MAASCYNMKASEIFGSGTHDITEMARIKLLCKTLLLGKLHDDSDRDDSESIFSMLVSQYQPNLDTLCRYTARCS